ncbi:LGFP repeat-containing protein [Saccharopolyspora spinosa]|uniref:LGFP repeat-containing protein n=2 Tax=Saccharopolyspora spinosa TaxID=60894 RepID=A0A2N3XSN8_SACSN|nr:LGFP repeat-containing protein [Saccharopolyspora spinosa]
MSAAEKAQVGEPAGAEVVADEGLRWQDFTHARFYWTPDTGVTVVRGMIYLGFLERGGHDELGVPITDELASSGGGRYSDFLTRDGVIHSAIYWSTRTGAHLVVGPILEHFRELGEDARFGYPATDTRLTPDAFGAYNHFLTPDAQHENASIYWTQPSGANAVRGAIRDKWAATGWERGPLGYPVTDELSTPDGVGRYNQFNGDGRFPAGIVWSPRTGAHSVQGVIAQRYLELSGPAGVLGYPTTDELGTPDGRGRYNHFTGTGGASVYWTPQTGAHEVYGGIRARWSQLGWERSYLGYPVTGEHDIPQGRASEFENGYVEWHRDTGAVVDFPKN